VCLCVYIDETMRGDSVVRFVDAMRVAVKIFVSRLQQNLCDGDLVYHL